MITNPFIIVVLYGFPSRPGTVPFNTVKNATGTKHIIIKYTEMNTNLKLVHTIHNT